MRSPDQVAQAYRKLVVPKRGGMFANVLAHHDASAPKPRTGAVAHALRCTTCGAPRIREGYDCPFCDNAMV